MMPISQFNIDKKTERRIRNLQKQKYPNPIEKANFEKLTLNELEKILFIANKVKKRRELFQKPNITTNPVTIKNIGDSYKFAERLVNDALKEKSIGTGLMGEAVLVASYSQISKEKLDIQILELNREIKRKKEILRVKYNAGNVDKLVNTAIPSNSKE